MPNCIAHAIDKDVEPAEDLTAAEATNDRQVNSVQSPTQMNIAAPMRVGTPPCIINICPTSIDRVSR